MRYRLSLLACCVALVAGSAAAQDASGGNKDAVPARSGPFSLRARYSNGATVEPSAFLVLGESDVIPAQGRLAPPGTGETILSDIALHLDPSNFGSLAIGSLERLVAIVYVGGSRKNAIIDVKPLSIDDASKNDLTLLKFNESVEPNEGVVSVTIALRAEFTKELLCAFESEYREAFGVPRTKFYDKVSGTSAAKDPSPQKYLDGPDKVKKKRSSIDATLPSKVITAKDRAGREIEVLFSFCGSDVTVYWAKTALDEPLYFFGDRPGNGVDAGHYLSDVHKRQLVGLLTSTKERKLLSPFSSNGAAIVVDQPDPTDNSDKAHGRTRVFIENSTSFKVVRTYPAFTFKEAGPYASDKPLNESGLVDQNSHIEVTGCPPFGPRLRFEVRDTGSSSASATVTQVSPSSKTTEAASPVSTQPVGVCNGNLDLDLKKFLGDTIDVSAVYEFAPGRFSPASQRTVLVAYAQSIRVANLGLITTFPVVSEIATAVQAKSLKDISSTSSIPISWVFGIGGTKAVDSVAVTFPWKLSYNSRSMPEFAKYLAIYAHVSIVVPTATANDPNNSSKLAVGFGVSALQVLNVAWAVKPGTTRSVPANYLLVGISIPDIAKLLASK